MHSTLTYPPTAFHKALGVSFLLQVLDKEGKVVPNVYCIGDANGKFMLAHAASAQVRTLTQQVLR